MRGEGFNYRPKRSMPILLRSESGLQSGAGLSHPIVFDRSQMKHLGTVITTLGLAAAICGFASCRHFADGDEGTDVSRVRAAETSFWVMTTGGVVFFIGLYARGKISRPK
jgi:hypothetical protein